MDADLRTHLIVTTHRRAELLSEEMKVWGQLADSNINKFGIHQSQIAAIRTMLEMFEQEWAELVPQLQNANEHTAFARIYQKASKSVLDANTIASIFRHILAQRVDIGQAVLLSDSSISTATSQPPSQATSESDTGPRIDSDLLKRYGKVLLLADITAGECYKYCLDNAITSGLMVSNARRVSPLVYFAARDSPDVAARDVATLGVLGLPVYEYKNWYLPVSVIALPFHYTSTIGALCSIYHEVGHLLTHDMRLCESLNPKVREFLVKRSESTNDETRIEIWEGWLPEIIADAVGVLLGGVSYAYFMFDVLFTETQFATQIKCNDSYPPTYIRLFLLASMLRATTVDKHKEYAAFLENRTAALYGEPNGLKEYLVDAREVGRILLNAPLIEGQPYRLCDIAPDLEEDNRKVFRLVEYFSSGYSTPPPGEYSIKYRHVPAAVYLATQQVTGNHYEEYKRIEDDAVEYCDQLKHAPFMGEIDETPGDPKFMRKLVAQFNI